MLYPFRRFARPLDTWVCARLDSCGGAATLGAASGPTGYQPCQLRAGSLSHPRKVGKYLTSATVLELLYGVPASQIIFSLRGARSGVELPSPSYCPRLTELHGVRHHFSFLFFLPPLPRVLKKSCGTNSAFCTRKSANLQLSSGRGRRRGRGKGSLFCAACV